MYMVTGTCRAAWLVACREVHRVERRKKLKLLVPEKLHTGAEWSVTTEDEVRQTPGWVLGLWGRLCLI